MKPEDISGLPVLVQWLGKYFRFFKNQSKHIKVEPTDYVIIYKEDAQANDHQHVVPVAQLLSGDIEFYPAVLTEELTVGYEVGGLTVGTVYPEGTLLETLWRDMLVRVYLSDLSFANYEAIVEVGLQVIPNKFTWNEHGTVGTLLLSDTEGNTYTPGIPGEASVLWSYTKNVPATVVWTLSSNLAPVDPITLTTQWIYSSYYGTSNSLPQAGAPLPNDSNDILAIVDDYIQVPLVTTNLQYGWIAVSGNTETYTKWFITELNQGNIGTSINDLEFIYYVGVTYINAVAYKLYSYSYPSSNVEPITLSLI